MPESSSAVAVRPESQGDGSRDDLSRGGSSGPPLTVADRVFADAFESCSLSEFHHSDHVRLAWIYLQRYPVLEALERLVAGIRRFAAADGTPELYHETVTWGYLLLIHERLERTGREISWQEFAAANPDLLVWKGGLLERGYRPETLASDLAKRVFVWPDRCSTG
jgi:hypothetical protein